MSSPRYTTRPGVTFIEVVLGVVLMGLVAGTLAAAVGGVGRSFQRQRDRLAAAEIASRILLQRVDDEEGMPDPSRPVGYGEREFMFSVEEKPTIVTLAAPAREAIDGNQRSGGVDLNRRILSVTVTAWLAEDSGGSAVFDARLPHASLTRLVDPIAFSTHDSAERRLDTQQDIERFLNEFVNTTTGSVNRPRPSQDGDRGGGGRRGGRPDPGAPGRGDGPPPAEDGG